ncbi:MAG TPA: lysophospholipid acyltransferase family protein [Candidatus Limnocylindrales bacterium]|nr:lysophospholipid acyltransferase family protein [Candidatus Limnocylindrales bacterium]
MRVVRRGTIVLWCVGGCLLEYAARAASGLLKTSNRAHVLHKWSRRLLAGVNAGIVVSGRAPDQGMIVSNHLSYLDILVFSAVSHCVFVAKREVKAWPGVGWIASLGGTIYIDRSRRTDTHSIQPEIQAALAGGVRLVVFPEGTSSDGSRVLPFHSSLFQPAVDLNTAITPAAIAYAIPDGDPATEACYWGDMTLATHFLTLLTKDSVQATLTFSSQQFRFSDRKQAAQAMQAEVERLLQSDVAARA